MVSGPIFFNSNVLPEITIVAVLDIVVEDMGGLVMEMGEGTGEESLGKLVPIEFFPRCWGLFFWIAWLVDDWSLEHCLSFRE